MIANIWEEKIGSGKTHTSPTTVLNSTGQMPGAKPVALTRAGSKKTSDGKLSRTGSRTTSKKVSDAKPIPLPRDPSQQGSGALRKQHTKEIVASKFPLSLHLNNHLYYIYSHVDGN